MPPNFIKPPVRNPPAFLPETSLLAGGTDAEAGRILSPRQIVLPCRVRIEAPHCLNTWKAEPQRKMSFPFSRKNSPPPNQESKRHFSLVSLAYSPVCGASVHSFIFRSKKVCAKFRITPQKPPSLSPEVFGGHREN